MNNQGIKYIFWSKFWLFDVFFRLNWQLSTLNNFLNVKQG